MIELAEIIGASVDLQPAGPGRLRGICPFHQEKTPSFFVFTDRNRWRCFGCHEHGDAIDFIRRSRGCGFLEAKKILGIDSPAATSVTIHQIRRKRTERLKAEWKERHVAWTLAKAIRLCHAALKQITPETFDHFAPALSWLSILEHEHDQFITGDSEARASVVAQYDSIRLFRRTLLFKPSFDCRQAMRGIEQEPTKCKHQNQERRQSEQRLPMQSLTLPTSAPSNFQNALAC